VTWEGEAAAANTLAHRKLTQGGPRGPPGAGRDARGRPEGPHELPGSSRRERPDVEAGPMSGGPA
jgi:hypothetical protein